MDMSDEISKKQPNETPLSGLLGAVLEMLHTKGDEIDEADYKYVIYIRKSTDDERKQQQTLSDQLKACQDLATRNNLNVVNIFTESHSAKISGARPVYRKMIDGIVAGDYHGIIAWAPDRLARNMREGGEIIDLLDEGTIKNLCFPSYIFANTAEGKMVLGMSFVLAKQWVEGHSRTVKRAVTDRTLEGMNLGRVKHGYFHDSKKHMLPDGENWELIKGVFDKRLEGYTLNEIADWLKKEGYPRKTEHGQRKSVVIDDAFISGILKETAYAGIFIHADQAVDLREHYDFLPMISEEDFYKVAGIKNLKKRLVALRAKSKKEIKANLLRGMVLCQDCGEPLAPTITTKPKQKKEYFYFRCDTPGCANFKINIRAGVILDAAYKLLDENPIPAESGHKHFKEEMARLAVEKQKSLTNEIRGAEQRKHHALDKIELVKKVIETNAEKEVQAVYGPELKKLRQDVKDVELELKQLRKQKDALTTSVATFDEFVELTQNLSQRLRNMRDMGELDYALRKLFSNFTVKGKKVTNVTQNSLFRELCAVPNSGMVTPRGVEPRLQA